MIAQTWAGDLSANRSLLSTASSARASSGVSAAGCGARWLASFLSAAGLGFRCRCSVARDLPSSSHALFTGTRYSSPVTAASITSAASRLSPRSRRAVPRARALFPRRPVQPSSAPVPRSASRSLSAVFRSPPLPRCAAAARMPCPPGHFPRSRRGPCAIRKGARCTGLPGAAARPCLRIVRQLLVLPEDPHLVLRGEGPPLRPARPRPVAGAHGPILPGRGGGHVCDGQRHVWWFPSRPAYSDVYRDLMSHTSLTERGPGPVRRPASGE
jgi:hypothetical protein